MMTLRADTPLSVQRYRLPFAACYGYSPLGDSVVSRKSRLLCAAVKQGHLGWMRLLCSCLREQSSGAVGLADYFPAAAILVPVPGRASARAEGPWVAHRLACEIQHIGLAAHVWPVLRRAKFLTSSAQAWRWQRPTVAENCESLAFRDIPLPRLAQETAAADTQLVLVDDVVTKGRTLLAAAMRLRERLPRAAIRGFALFRTMGLVGELASLVEPCRGFICWNGFDADRSP
jgi:hypothetical protein